MKTGYAAGAVAGFIVGIPAFIFGLIILPWYIGLSLSEILQFAPIGASIHIGFNTFWGLVWGVLFAKFYDVIPGESGLKKGLMWGVIYALIEWWSGMSGLGYQIWWSALIWAVYGPVVIFFYGLPLGYLYEGTQHPVQPEDKRKHKPIASVIAGLVGGIVVAVLMSIRPIMGIPNPTELIGGIPLIPNVVTLEFIVAFIWGIIFSVVFVLLYPRLPGKNVMKGLYYGLIIYSITMVYLSVIALMNFSSIPGYIQGIGYGNIASFLANISLGIVLGYFYKK